MDRVQELNTKNKNHIVQTADSPSSSIDYSEESINFNRNYSPIMKNSDQDSKSNSNSMSLDSTSESISEDTTWPIVTYFILFVEFCERFCYYGFRSILVIYIQEYFGFQEAKASQIYHLFGLLVYFFPIVGAVISDSYWGRFKTIWRFCVVYFIGLILLTVSAVPTWFLEASGADRTIHSSFAYIGLFLIAVGSGGIKPCVSAFGADQFKPHQAKAKESYFKWFYLLINLGAIISAYLTPILKKMDCYDLSQNDKMMKSIWNTNSEEHANQRLSFDSCHYMSYLVPTVLMFIGICTFLLPPAIYFLFKDKDWEFAAQYKYTKTPHRNSNILFKFIEIISSAVKNIFTKNTQEKFDRSRQEEGFIRFSGSKNGQLRRSTYRIIQIAVLYIPLVFFWAIMEQIGSLWTFQAKELNLWTGNLYTQADQVEVLNNVFVVILIPIWTVVFLPVIKKSPIYNKSSTRKNMPLHMMAAGLFLTAVSQFAAWNLQLKLNSELTFSENNEAVSPVKIYYDSSIGKESLLSLEKIKDDCPDIENEFKYLGNGEMKGNGVIGTEVFDGSCYSVKSGDKIFSLTTDKNPENDPLIAWFRSNGSEIVVNFIMGGLTNQQNEGAVRVCEAEDLEKNSTSFNDCQQVEKQKFGEEYEPTYANGAVFIKDSETGVHMKITNGRTISVALIVIQYFLLTFGEVLLSTTALEFSYTQAPSSVKAISTALWYSTTAFANVVVIMLKSMESLSRDTQLLASAGMVVLAMLGFMLIAWNFEVYSQTDIERLDRDDDSKFLQGSGSSDEIDTSRTPMINSNA
jgi:dipeptide/tripeptide permease